MDLISDMLRVVRLSGAVFLRARLSAPYHIDTPAAGVLCRMLTGGDGHLITFHVISEGECSVEPAGARPLHLKGPSVIILPGGDAHALKNGSGGRPITSMEVIPRAASADIPSIDHGGGGPTTRVVCGFLRCDDLPFNPCLGALPGVMTVTPSASPGWLHGLVDQMVTEVDAKRPGCAAMLARLSELLFVEIVRRRLAELPPEEKSWLAGARDPHVSRALTALHQQPAQAWTVAELAQRAGLSRSALAERFNRLLGMSPMHYLTQWRLTLAAQLLRTTEDGVAAVAARVGYDSEAAFSRAFKQYSGVPPSAWRRRANG